MAAIRTEILLPGLRNNQAGFQSKTWSNENRFAQYNRSKTSIHKIVGSYITLKLLPVLRQVQAELYIFYFEVLHKYLAAIRSLCS